MWDDVEQSLTPTDDGQMWVPYIPPSPWVLDWVQRAYLDRSFNFVETNITETSLAKIAAIYHNARYKPWGDLKVHNRAAYGTVNFYYWL